MLTPRSLLNTSFQCITNAYRAECALLALAASTGGPTAWPALGGHAASSDDVSDAFSYLGSAVAMKSAHWGIAWKPRGAGRRCCAPNDDRLHGRLPFAMILSARVERPRCAVNVQPLNLLAAGLHCCGCQACMQRCLG